MRSWDQFLVAIKKIVFFYLYLSLSYRLCIPICFNTNQFTFYSRNPFYKAYTDEKVKNSMFRRIDVFNKNIAT